MKTFFHSSERAKSFWPTFGTVILICLFFLILFSCEKDEDATTQTIIAKGVNVIDSQVWNKQIISVDPSNYTIRFSNDINSVQQIKVGDIIISDVGEGLLRKVKNINTINNELVVETEFASLSEAIQQGTINVKISLTNSQIKGIAYHADGVKLINDLTKGSDQATYNWDINTVLYDFDGYPSTTADQIKLVGNFSCDMQIPLFIDYRLFQGLKEVKFGIESSENIDLRLVTGLEYGFEKEVNLATVYFTPIIIMVGVVPVIFTPELDVIAGVGGSANAPITSEINQKLTFDAGIRYLKGQGWSPYKTFSKDFGYQPPQLNLNTSAEMYIKPELSLRIYGVAGPYANLKLYGRLDANILQNPWWTLYGGIKMAAGAKVSILDLFTLDFVISDLLNYEQVLAQATSQPVIKPVAAFSGSPTTITAGQSVQFTDQSINSPTSWSWNFGDGGTSTLQNPSHTYSTAGTYTVILTATNSGGSDGETKTNYITVNPVVITPVATFTGSPTTITAGQSVQFTDQSANSPTSWSWNFGDGGTSTLQNPSHTYSTAGTYTVTLTATNSAGSDGETKNGYITVNPVVNAPVAAFSGSPTTITAGQSVQFTDQSINSPTSWSWNFGDGGTSTLQNPSHTYSTAGTYTVKLTATNSAGSDGETKNGYITVNPVVNAPVAAFSGSPTTITAGQSVQFTDQSTNSPTSWSWNFGDGGTSTLQNPSHTYSAAGTYTVTLTATNSAGSDGETKNDYITVNPNDNFSLYSTTSTSGGSSIPNTLILINSINGEGIVSGPVGSVKEQFSLDMDPVTGSLFGVNPDKPGVIEKIDVKSGTSIPASTITQSGSPVQLWGIAFNPDGILYGINGNRILGIINQNEGTFTPINQISVSGVIVGIDFSPQGTLYAILKTANTNENLLITVDEKTAIITSSSKLSGDYSVGDIDYSSDGYIYGTNFSWALLRINPIELNITIVGFNNFGALGGIASF